MYIDSDSQKEIVQFLRLNYRFPVVRIKFIYLFLRCELLRYLRFTSLLSLSERRTDLDESVFLKILVNIAYSLGRRKRLRKVFLKDVYSNLML